MGKSTVACHRRKKGSILWRWNLHEQKTSGRWRRAYNVGRPSPLVWSSLEKMPCTRKDCSQGGFTSNELQEKLPWCPWAVTGDSVSQGHNGSLSHTQPLREHTEDDGKVWEKNRRAAEDGVLQSRENVRALLTSKLNQTTQRSRKPSSESSHLNSKSV